LIRIQQNGKDAKRPAYSSKLKAQSFTKRKAITNKYIKVSVINFNYSVLGRRRILQSGTASERVGMIGYDIKKVVNYQESAFGAR
jgi:hypothetical protein